MSYRITLDPYDHTRAHVSRRILPALPLYLSIDTVEGAIPADALQVAAASIEADIARRADLASAAGVLWRFLSRISGGR